MMNRKSTRLLITLVLAAAISAALGSEAFAAKRYSSRDIHATAGSIVLKPGSGTMSGEPDTGGNAPPPKDGTYPTGGSTLSIWAVRIQWAVRAWLNSSPVRFPH